MIFFLPFKMLFGDDIHDCTRNIQKKMFFELNFSLPPHTREIMHFDVEKIDLNMSLKLILR